MAPAWHCLTFGPRTMIESPADAMSAGSPRTRRGRTGPCERADAASAGLGGRLQGHVVEMACTTGRPHGLEQGWKSVAWLMVVAPATRCPSRPSELALWELPLSMKPYELEAWVLSIADKVVSRTPVEDSRVELKREWPDDPNKAARRLGGQCNAARGADVLWIVGLDEREGAVVGAEHNDLAGWLPAVQREFVEIARSLLLDLNVPRHGKSVSALLFSSSRSPYVVRNVVAGKAGGGPIESEVPWREGTRVRTARREDLLRILVPAVHTPTVELVRATCRFQTCSHEASVGRSNIDRSTLWVELMLYFSPRSEGLLAFPEHRRECRASFSAPKNNVIGRLEPIRNPRNRGW